VLRETWNVNFDLFLVSCNYDWRTW